MQCPSTFNGLGFSEQRALEAVAAGAGNAGQTFHSYKEGEDQIFPGDGTFYHYLRRLTAEPHPLLEVEPPADGGYFGKARLRLTEEGRGVLAGKADAVAERGIDRWFGGVHLKGKKDS